MPRIISALSVGEAAARPSATVAIYDQWNSYENSSQSCGRELLRKTGPFRLKFQDNSAVLCGARKTGWGPRKLYIVSSTLFTMVEYLIIPNKNDKFDQVFVKEKFKKSRNRKSRLCQLFEMTLSAMLFQISKKSRVLVGNRHLYSIVRSQFTRYTFNSQSCNLFLLNGRSVWILRIECKRK